MYPLKMYPIYFEKIWGGRALAKFRQDIPEGNIGESWDIACHPAGTSVVSNGDFKGIALDKLIEMDPEKILGKRVLEFNQLYRNNRVFPLLVKLISASQPLSVQVHPNDEQNFSYSGEPGKTECWYVIEAEEGSELIIGTETEVNKQEFINAVKANSLDSYLNRIKVKKGDFFFIPSGMIHAIGAGVIILEIQQNSDTTFRVYDYGRPRELHLEKAMEVVDLSLKPIVSKNKRIKMNGYWEKELIECTYFSVKEVEIAECFRIPFSEERFIVITCAEGRGEIKNNLWKGDIQKGDSFLIPANCMDTYISGQLKLIVTEPFPKVN